jgi:hypothetical protein
MPRVRVESERERASGWQFEVVVVGTGERRTLTLSWADHERWTGGARPPSETAERVARFVVERGLLARLRERFDASTVRRIDPGLDEAVSDDRYD